MIAQPEIPTNEHRAEPESAAGTPRLSVRELRHAFGRNEVLNGLTFDVRPGEVFGMLGPNGSGKSTAMAILSGILPLQDGRLLVDGTALTPNDRRWREDLGVIFQSPSLDAKLTAVENLKLAAALYGIKGADAKRRIDEQLAGVGLESRAKEPVGNYSGGMKRRLDIARALLHEPSILFMDEPTAGLDEASFRRAWERLDAMRQERGLTIILATHRPEEADKCDRLAILRGGKADLIDTPQALRERISTDMIALVADDLEPLRDQIRERFGLEALVDAGELLIECEKGHEIIPRLVEAFPEGRFKSVSLRQASLADVFLKITGFALDDDQPAAPDGSEAADA
ncbi:MAG: ABC transporter ATP-binding protein [Deltaproteobacteria bacterium]|nr:ABC transporter ATP-binding protein [Deltaproteobacteria bacterium]MCB9478445.1 ABC transporter ATP-binding protein [Deltaproteobacteria bacterium]MCB9489944.1 ABC transporter ATP-binding protein [Deltaproteobacteria bacterium]